MKKLLLLLLCVPLMFSCGDNEKIKKSAKNINVSEINNECELIDALLIVSDELIELKGLEKDVKEMLLSDDLTKYPYKEIEDRQKSIEILEIRLEEIENKEREEGWNEEDFEHCEKFKEARRKLEKLSSYYEVNLGIVKTTTGLDKKNSETYAAFEDATNQEKVKNYKNLANQVKPISSELVEDIQKMKYKLVLKTDGKVFLGQHKDEEGDEIEDNIFEVNYSELSDIDKSKKIAFLGRKDARHTSGEVFNPENKPNLPRKDGIGQATHLKNKIEEFRQSLLTILKTAEDSSWIASGSADKLIRDINENLKIKDDNAYGEKGKKVTWEKYNFYDMPAVGALTLLSKWQSDILNMESAVIAHLIEQH